MMILYDDFFLPQVKLVFDKEASSLYVTILAAEGILPKENGGPRNPYSKIYLLPDRRYVFPVIITWSILLPGQYFGLILLVLTLQQVTRCVVL